MVRQLPKLPVFGHRQVERRIKGLQATKLKLSGRHHSDSVQITLRLLEQLLQPDYILCFGGVLYHCKQRICFYFLIVLNIQFLQLSRTPRHYGGHGRSSGQGHRRTDDIRIFEHGTAYQQHKNNTGCHRYSPTNNPCGNSTQDLIELFAS